MGRKHNTKHRRSESHYPERLRKRGETSASVRMRMIDDDSHASFCKRERINTRKLLVDFLGRFG